MKLFKVLSLLIYSLLPISLDAQVQVKLHQPPPNQLKIEHLWWVDLTNSTQTSYTVHLRAEVTEARKGLIFRASSNTFTLTPGKKRITARDIKDVKDVWYSSKYKEFIVRTGGVPEGDYTACIYVINTRNNQEIGSNCLHHIVRQPGFPRLISPRMGLRLKGKNPLFSWTRPAPFPTGEKVTYKIRIVEVLPGQTKEEAIRSNKPWYEQKGITKTTFLYSIRARPFEKGKTYAWQVQAFDKYGYPLGRKMGLSEIWMFEAWKYFIPVRLPQVLKMGDFILKNMTYTTGSTIDSLSGSGKSYFVQKTPSGHFGGPIYILTEREFDVNFSKMSAQVLSGDTAEVLQGEIIESLTEPLDIYVEGFNVMVHDVHLWPDSAHAGLGVSIACFYDSAGCEPAELGPFDEKVKPEIEIYRELPVKDRGPYRLGETGILVKSKEEILIDLSRTITPSKIGITFNKGRTVAQPDMDTSNTGYLYGEYEFIDGLLTPLGGFGATLELLSTWNFTSLVPMGFQISLSSGFLEVDSCKIKRGKFTAGQIILPKGDNGVHDNLGKSITVYFDSLVVDTLLNLSGLVKINKEMRWGGFGLDCEEAKFLLPSNPYPYFSLAKGDSLSLPDADTLIGLTIPYIDRHKNTLIVYTEDARSSIKFSEMGNGWFNLEMQGMRGYIGSDGETPTKQVYLGIPGKVGYLADSSFTTTLSHNEQDSTFMKFWFVGNSSFDSDLRGEFRIPSPCKMNPPFRNMEVTSTASFVGGNAAFRDTLILDYWGVGITSRRGVVSVKVGEIVYTNADIHEKVHFSKGFNIIWGEMLADGGLGEFFFNHNAANQKFDGFPITLDSAALSKYDPSIPGELVVRCGIHFNFFGEPDTMITIHDAKYSDTDLPYRGRLVTIDPREFALFRNWGSELAEMDFDIVEYDALDQNGFIGEGNVALAFFTDSPLDASIVIDSTLIQVCISETKHHNLALPPFTEIDVFTALGQIWGCATIEGDELSRIVIGGRMEQTGGILVAQSGVGVEVKMVVTPTLSSFVADGVMYLSVIAGGDAEMTGHIALTCDRSVPSLEGEIKGAFDFSSLAAGLEADGQVNWHLEPASHYLQGRLAVKIHGLKFGAGLAGGVFLGYNTPQSRAWVLQEGSSSNRKFGINMDNLPHTLTGVYVFGDVDWSQDFGIFSGGLEIYAGVGAFIGYTQNPEESSMYNAGLPLPYVVAIIGIYLHGEILWGVVSASAWGELEIMGPYPVAFQGTVGLKGCVLWVFCASVKVEAGLSSAQGFYLN